MRRVARILGFAFSLSLGLLAPLAHAAGTPVPLTPGVNASPFVISPDGSRVVFEGFVGDTSILHVVPTNGLVAPTPISTPVAPTFLFNTVISLDGSAVLFNTLESGSDGSSVSTYANSLANPTPTPTLLNTARLYDDDVSQYNLAFSPDSRRAVIRADHGDFAFDLLSRPVDASSAAVPLNPNPGSEVFGAGVGYDWRVLGGRALFSESFVLHSRPVDASLPAVQLSPNDHAALAVASHPNSPLVVFVTASSPSNAVRSLFSRPLDGEGPATPLLAPGVDAADLTLRGLKLSPDGRHAILTSADYRLHTIPTDGSAAAPTPLSPFPTPGLSVDSTISPDGRSVAFLARPENGAPDELYISPIDGSAAPKKLSAPLPPGGRIEYFEFSPDGSRLVYFGEQLTDGLSELFSVPADGSAGPTHLGQRTSFTFTPDSRYLILAADARAFQQPALHLMPIDGGEAELLVSRPFPTGGIHRWSLTPDGSTLVFAASTGDGARSELFALAMPAGAVPEPMTLALPLLAVSSLRRRRRRTGTPGTPTSS